MSNNRHIREKMIQLYGAEEVWKDIKDYEGLYQVSNLGNVRSLDREVKDTTKNRIQHIKGKILKLTDNGKGYKLVFLNKDRNRENKYVHRLVAETFIPNPNNLKEVNHKNLNKNDNSVHNLEWITSIDNKRHYRQTEISKINNLKAKETLRKNYGEKTKKATSYIIYAYTQDNLIIKEISKQTGIGQAKISKILKENNIPLNNRYRKKYIYKRNSLGRFIKGGVLVDKHEEE